MAREGVSVRLELPKMLLVRSPMSKVPIDCNGAGLSMLLRLGVAVAVAVGGGGAGLLGTGDDLASSRDVLLMELVLMGARGGFL